MFNKIFSLFILGSLLFSCKDDKVELNNVPSIEFLSITPAEPHQYSDSITITIKYSDGNGDLGENNSSAENCFVTDTRNNIVYPFRIKQLAPNDQPIAITGKLDIKMTAQYILGMSDREQVSYTVYVKDRAGNESNRITTSAVTLIR